jgi:hypothetical protein
MSLNTQTDILGNRLDRLLFANFVEKLGVGLCFEA